MRESLFYRNFDAWEPLLDRFILVKQPLLIRVAFLAESEEYLLLEFKRTAKVVQRKTLIALCTAYVVDSLPITVTLNQSLGETKRWVNTSLTSDLRRRLTDLTSQSIWGL